MCAPIWRSGSSCDCADARSKKSSQPRWHCSAQSWSAGGGQTNSEPAGSGRTGEHRACATAPNDGGAATVSNRCSACSVSRGCELITCQTNSYNAAATPNGAEVCTGSRGRTVTTSPPCHCGRSNRAAANHGYRTAPTGTVSSVPACRCPCSWAVLANTGTSSRPFTNARRHHTIADAQRSADAANSEARPRPR